MLQSILYQLLTQEPSLFPIFRDSYRAERRAQGSDITWKLPILVRLLKFLANSERNGKVYIVLDAMDESDDRQLPLILDNFQDISSSTSGCTIKAVMTTRPLPKKITKHPMKQLSSLSLILEQKNQPDIDIIVDQEISRITADAMDEDNTIEPSVFDSIRDYIKNHAEGVFLWVDLVLREVRNLTDQGWSHTKLDQLKTVLPPKLMDLYQRITQRLGGRLLEDVGSSRVDLQACKLEYSIVSPK